MESLYPAGPQNVPAELTKPTSVYKQRAWLAVASLALFVVLYIALASWFMWTAYRLLGDVFGGGEGGFIHFLVGGGAAFLSLFMLKALFFVKKGGALDALEVTQAEQPRLFEFLYRLADEAGAPRPKRVFLSARVNACVFYDLSILNLLFPSRKSLEIGLALVNVLTLSEMKAVLAHEFGHFAQRSMAIGSWVYIAQQIASHIIAKRDALDKFLQGLSNFDFRIAWIGWILSLIVWSIRSLMDSLLRLVVLAQRALSRQMEFQADLVAVSLTGSDELVHALHKLQAADNAWEESLNFAGTQARLEKQPHDLFEVHTRVIDKMAHILADENYGKVPKAEGQGAEQRVFKSSFAQPPQMWSTHPASADREENAKRAYLPAPHDPRSAWLLFDQPQQTGQKVVAHMMGETKAQPMSAEETWKALDERFALLQYDTRYRGAYLGRSIARFASTAAELYTLPQGVKPAELAELYPPQLAQDLEKMRELENERYTLQALRDKVYEATGGRIVYRGREIARRELPAAIEEVRKEEAQVRERILDHDRHCRAAHLAVAEALGGGWKEYLLGLLRVLHYADHTLADVRDAQGVLGNVFAIVTADGKVSSGELTRLIETANLLHSVLEPVYRRKEEVQLDASLCERLEVEGWPAMLEEFTLPPATRENVNDWFQVIDGWINAATGALSALRGATMEQLLHTEQELARHAREQSAPPEAPAPSRVPAAYPVLLQGNERKRQNKLDWWSRFQTADGVFPEVARLAVAGAIVCGVLGFGSVTGSTSTITVYNGLARTVTVNVGGEQRTMSPFSTREIVMEMKEPFSVEARTLQGKQIESFKPQLDRHTQHYIYNVAGASPMVEWTAVYGSASESPPRYLGAPRWFTSHVDVYFDEPPKSVRTKGGGATRRVLSGAGDRSPYDTLKVLESNADRMQVLQAHAAWDEGNSENAQAWRQAAQGRITVTSQ